MVAVFLEHSERWIHPVYTSGLFALIVVLALIGISRRGFLFFLIISTTQILAMQFPDVANHVNLILFINLMLIVSITWSLTRRATQEVDAVWFESIRPLLQLTLVLVYVVAGFHKLNIDFINPEVSCVQRTISLLRHMVASRLLGIPTIAVLALGGAATAALLLMSRPLPKGLLRAVLLLAVLGTAVLALLPSNTLPAFAKVAIVAGLIVVVLSWEIIGGLLLLVPRAQLAVVTFSWSMHATLALISFVDFGALAFALLFTFVPERHTFAMAGSVSIPVLRLRLPRPACYLILALVVGLCQLWSTVAAGIAFNAAALVMIWPLLRALVDPTERQPWPGVPLRFATTPRGLFVFPVLLLVHGMTGYLGLRTAGNFSMFSNLRTEGARSNHLLLGSNPLKIWGYQEDVVHFVDAFHEQVPIGYNYQPLQDRQLPVVEFRKLISWWTRAGRTVPLVFDYGGVRHQSNDIVNDPEWRSRGWDWEMRLMDFRVIQPEGPNRCRW